MIQSCGGSKDMWATQLTHKKYFSLMDVIKWPCQDPASNFSERMRGVESSANEFGKIWQKCLLIYWHLRQTDILLQQHAIPQNLQNGLVYSVSVSHAHCLICKFYQLFSLQCKEREATICHSFVWWHSSQRIAHMNLSFK